MKITKLKKIYKHEIESKIKTALEMQTLDYRLRDVIDELCEDGLYKYDYSGTVPKLRFTFPLFLILILIANIYASIKWLFTGNIRFSNNSLFTEYMVKWDKYCGFNIL